MIIHWRTGQAAPRFGIQNLGGMVIDWSFYAQGNAPVVAPVVVRTGYSPVPEILPDEKEHRRKLAAVVNSMRNGKLNAVTNVTLTPGGTTTTFTDQRITPQSVILLMPQTANAAAAVASLAGPIYVSSTTQVNGSAVITHASNAQTDRTFAVLIIG